MSVRTGRIEDPSFEACRTMHDAKAESYDVSNATGPFVVGFEPSIGSATV